MHALSLQISTTYVLVSNDRILEVRLDKTRFLSIRVTNFSSVNSFRYYYKHALCAVARLGLILLLSQKIKKKLWPRRSCFSREHFTINNIDFAFFFFCCTYTRNYSGKRTFSEPRLYIVNLATLVIFGSDLYKCFNVFILENCFFFFSDLKMTFYPYDYTEKTRSNLRFKSIFYSVQLSRFHLQHYTFNSYHGYCYY